jgi:hypothetical protein
VKRLEQVFKLHKQEPEGTKCPCPPDDLVQAVQIVVAAKTRGIN